jgi:hypothetical protein
MQRDWCIPLSCSSPPARNKKINRRAGPETVERPLESLAVHEDSPSLRVTSVTARLGLGHGNVTPESNALSHSFNLSFTLLQ